MFVLWRNISEANRKTKHLISDEKEKTDEQFRFEYVVSLFKENIFRKLLYKKMLYFLNK